MFFPARFIALHKTTLVQQGSLHSMSSALDTGVFFFPLIKCLFIGLSRILYSQNKLAQDNPSLSMYVFQNITYICCYVYRIQSSLCA